MKQKYHWTIMAAIVLLSGCWPQPSNPIVDPPATHTEAERLVRDLLSIEMDRSLPDLDIDPVWLSGHCMHGEGVDGHYSDPEVTCIRGLFSKDWLGRTKIWIMYEEKVYQTALVHEMVHYYLFLLYGNSDGAHNNHIWVRVPSILDALKEKDL